MGRAIHRRGSGVTFKVYEEQCDQCLFSPTRIVSAKRVAEVLRDCVKKDSHFICHKATIQGKDIACRAWYDRMTSNLSRIAGRLQMVEFVKQEEPHG